MKRASKQRKRHPTPRSTSLVSAVALAALVLLATQGCGWGNRPSHSITIRGSDTQVNLLQQLAEIYMDHHPHIAISITGGGSGTGIAALLRRQTDIAASSRPITQAEQDLAGAAGITPLPFVIALDGLALIVHQDNPVSSLSLEQVAELFQGRIAQWIEVGGNREMITLYGRQGNSGTFVYFRNHVVKDDYSSAMNQMNGNAQIVEAVRRDKQGMGYVGLGYVVKEDGGVAEGIKALSLQLEGEAVSPLQAESIHGGRYPLLRPLFHYTNGKPMGDVHDFLKFILSEEGQNVVEQEGFYPVSPLYQAANKEGLSS